MEGKTVTAIVGSYRKGGIVDQAVDEVLASAAACGAQVQKVYLIDKRIKFCTNCRSCTQEDSPIRGACKLQDDMPGLLDTIEASNAIVLASPMNFWTVTAVMKVFIERLVCYAYWPWGAPAPHIRRSAQNKRAVLIASSAAPAFLARFTTRIVPLLKRCAGILGATTVGVLFLGLSAIEARQAISPRSRARARRLGQNLVRYPI